MFNSVAEIITFSRLTFADVSQSAIQQAITEAQSKIDVRIPPRNVGDDDYAYYERRLPQLKNAHLYFATASLLRRLASDEILHDPAGVSFSTVDMSFGAERLGTETERAQKRMDMAIEYEKQGEEIVRQCKYRFPVVKRPRRLRLKHAIYQPSGYVDTYSERVYPP